MRFIIPAEEISRGEEINMAVKELTTQHFMVIWNDLRILRGPTEITAERLCTVPVVQNGQAEIVPTIIAPVIIKRTVKTLPFAPVREAQPALYPFDGIGIYNRERFLRLGGFDISFRSFYWQLMDFGFRSRLWGEEIAVSLRTKLSYEGEVTPVDNTADENFRRFYLKNLAPVFLGDHANLPLRRFPPFLWKLNSDLFSAWDEFSLVRQWVKTNRFRFCCDSRALAELWGDAGNDSEDDNL